MGRHIKQACGRYEVVVRFGKLDARDARMARMEAEDGADCRAVGSDLIGTPNQIPWAEDILARAIPDIKAEPQFEVRVMASPAGDDADEAQRLLVRTNLTRIRDYLISRKPAVDWIESQGTNAYAIFSK